MTNTAQETTINSRKFDGSIHRVWQANLVVQRKNFLSFVGLFDKQIDHPHLGVIRRGTVSYEYYWLDRWFSIFQFHEPEGNLRNFYCNINCPPTFEKNVLDYVDLDIDILVWKDFSYKILDVDEFQENIQVFKYSRNLQQKVMDTIDLLLDLITNRKFPFDFEVGNR